MTERFKDWYQTIIRTVDKGIVTDPLGDMVELVTDNGKGPKVTQVSNGAPLIEDGDKPNISIENSNRQIKVDNINLTRNQEIELEYTVRLKVDDPTFVSNQWYPTNNETILRPTPERTNDRLEFGRPSVKFQKADFTIPVEKYGQILIKGMRTIGNCGLIKLPSRYKNKMDRIGRMLNPSILRQIRIGREIFHRLKVEKPIRIESLNQTELLDISSLP